MTIAFKCCGHSFRMPGEWAACPLCRQSAKGCAGEPLEADQWEADGKLYSETFDPVEWAEARR